MTLSAVTYALGHRIESGTSGVNVYRFPGIQVERQDIEHVEYLCGNDVLRS